MGWWAVGGGLTLQDLVDSHLWGSGTVPWEAVGGPHITTVCIMHASHPAMVILDLQH